MSMLWNLAETLIVPVGLPSCLDISMLFRLYICLEFRVYFKLYFSVVADSSLMQFKEEYIVKVGVIAEECTQVQNESRVIWLR